MEEGRLGERVTCGLTKLFRADRNRIKFKKAGDVETSTNSSFQPLCGHLV